jgi:dephospho-CoA kinase
VSARPYVVALSGGVASGKSAVCARLAEHGVPIFDADVAARAVVEPEQPALIEIVAVFGADIIDERGRLRRRALRERVFADPKQRRALEAIVHPRVREYLRAQVDTARAPYVVLAIPLLVEAWHDYRWVDRVVMVDCTIQTQLHRLMQRDGVTRELAERMIAAQSSRAARLALADEVLTNDGTLSELLVAVDGLHQRLSEHAQTRTQASNSAHD